MNPGEYEVTCNIVRRKFWVAVNAVNEPVKEFTFEFLHYDIDDLKELIIKSLELEDVDVELETTRFEHSNILKNLTKCTLARKDGKFIINELTLIGNSFTVLGDSIIYDNVRRVLIKDASSNVAVSMLTGLPYILTFDIKRDGMEELLKLVRPLFEDLRKNINAFSSLLDLMMETVGDGSDSIKLVIHLVFV